MNAHPIIDYPYRWVLLLLLALVLVVSQVVLLCGYTEAGFIPAVVDGVATIGWLAILVWFMVSFIPLFETDVIIVVVAALLWLGGSFMACDIMVRIIGVSYIPFAPTIPFRLLFGVPLLVTMTLWYRLQILKESISQEQVCEVKQELAEEAQVEAIDRITVKDGARIHLIKVDELLYIQACGDYVTLNTNDGEYIKEQTMKYFETHLSADTFVRVHRSTIVNITQISRIELFGKETYMLQLKNGVKLKVSLSGYRLLKEKIGL